MKEVIVPADDLVCIGKEKLQEVIRCKDCKHCMMFSMFTSKWYVCCRNEKGVDVEAEDFCSKAERGKNERV